jgi:acetolactate synthase-1/2/3 large subunit
LDIEPSQVGRNVPVEVPLVGDAKAILQALMPQVNRVDRPDWMNYIADLRRNHPSLSIPNGDKLQTQHVLRDLNELIQENQDTVVVTGVGQHQMWAAQFLLFDRSNSFVSSGGLGAMGFELPAALGVQAAKPNIPVWTVAGDGGFQMTSQELATLSHEKLPVKMALFNNGYLGMVRQWQELFFDNHLSAVPVPGPDYVKLAQAYGVGAVRVTEREDVLPALRQAQEYDGPFLIEFVVDPSGNVYPMVPPGGGLADTLEDPAV